MLLMGTNQKASILGGWKVGQDFKTYLCNNQCKTYFKRPCLKFFWDETVDALKFHWGMQSGNVDGTVTLITKIIGFWKRVSVKSLFEGLRSNDSLRDAISAPTDLCLDDLMELAELVVSMAASQQQTCCKGVREVVKHIFAKSHSYVLLGKFATDPFERAIDKLRQVLEKFNVSKAKLTYPLFWKILLFVNRGAIQGIW